MIRFLLSLVVGVSAVTSQPRDSNVSFVETQTPDDIAANSTAGDYGLQLPPSTPGSSPVTRGVRDDAAAAESTTSASRATAAPAPRSLSKLGHSRAAANSVEKSGKGSKRKYKSRCRCEKIWNCPKLQITVPRCPEEYFLCCF